jgi:cell division protein FtsQ
LQPVREAADSFAAVDGEAERGEDEAFWLSRRRRRLRAVERGDIVPRWRLWFDWWKARSKTVSEIASGMAILLVLATVAYGLVLNGDAGRLGAALMNVVDERALRWGFGIERAVVEGHRYLTEAEIDAALGDRGSVSILSYDTEAARARLERVGWVKSAKVTRLWPSTLVVELEERRPFALWRPNGAVDVGSGAPGQMVVVDLDGTVLGPAEPGSFPGLPVVAGAGAPQAARRLVAALNAAPSLKARVECAERVSDRRWDLVLKEGVRLKLAESGLDPATLKHVVDAVENPRLPLEVIAALDFRVANQIGLELKDQSEENRQKVLQLLSAMARGKRRDQM